MSWSSKTIGKKKQLFGNFARHRSIIVKLRNIHEHTYRIGYDWLFQELLQFQKDFDSI
jgi:hypothetical protein